MAGVLPGSGSPEDVDIASNRRSSHCESPDPQVHAEDEPALTLTIHLHNEPLELSFANPDATINDLSQAVTNDLSIPPTNQKFLITPKTGLLKPPFRDPTLPLSTLLDKKIVALGATSTEVADQQAAINTLRARQEARRAAHATARRTNKPIKSATPKQDAQYTFHTLRPLAHMPHPEKSLRFLERLRADPGIRAAMRSHAFAVPLLTEMDPAEHTTASHEGVGRTLGLNRNRGEAIELRLRTDAGDGYRDYRVIRKTLCHELAHCEFGDHDRHFWKLCKEIEAEVERNDSAHGGHVVGGQGAEFYVPGDVVGDGEIDGGGWVGGNFVLGGKGGGEEGLSRREMLARAAEERLKRGKEGGEGGGEVK